MLGFTTLIRIEAPVERVFELFTDLNRAAQRIAAVKRIERLTDGPFAVGTRFREMRIMFGREETQEMVVTAFDPLHRYVVECLAHGAHYFTTFTFEPAGQATVVTLDFRARTLTLAARIMAGATFWMMQGTVRRAVEQDMEDLKAAAEAPAMREGG